LQQLQLRRMKPGKTVSQFSGQCEQQDVAAGVCVRRTGRPAVVTKGRLLLRVVTFTVFVVCLC